MSTAAVLATVLFARQSVQESRELSHEINAARRIERLTKILDAFDPVSFRADMEEWQWAQKRVELLLRTLPT